MNKLKDFLTFENNRNKRNAGLYCYMLHLAYGPNYDVLIGHHLNFQEHGHINTINEVSSADTLIFDHEVMSKIFGKEAKRVMIALASVPSDNDEREKVLWHLLENHSEAE